MYKVYVYILDSTPNTLEKMNMVKTIKVENDLHNELGQLGSTHESFNDIIRKLVKYWKTGKKEK